MNVLIVVISSLLLLLPATTTRCCTPSWAVPGHQTTVCIRQRSEDVKTIRTKKGHIENN
jgi:hypothetical protein|tara:strand:+ start:256 stop:432 length:177 start_codon:yes stop_codon:yes gene_type:complete